jgi:hypothetical protein
MDVRLTSNAKQVSRRIGKKGKELSNSFKMALLKTGIYGLNIIEDRTAKGNEVGGTAFEGYTEKYAFFRASKGRTPVKVDLRFTGQMLSSMSVRASSRSAEIYFLRATEAKKAAMNNKKRPFFGFSRLEEKRLGEVFFKALK